MAKYLSAAAVKHRANVAYHRAQGLARNAEYRRDIKRLQKGWEEDGTRIRGLRFDRRSGMLDEPAVGYMWVLVEKVCRHSGLKLPMLPSALKRLSRDALAKRDSDIFEDVPGWTWVKRRPVRMARDRRQPMSYLPSPPAPLRLEDYEPLGFTYEDIVARAEKSKRRVRSVNAGETIFRMVTVPLRRLSKRHRGVDDDSDDLWKVFDLHSNRRSERQIAAQLWPARLGVDVKSARQMAYDHLQKARDWIKASYSPSPPQPERRPSRGPRENRTG